MALPYKKEVSCCGRVPLEQHVKKLYNETLCRMYFIYRKHSYTGCLIKNDCSYFEIQAKRDMLVKRAIRSKKERPKKLSQFTSEVKSIFLSYLVLNSLSLQASLLNNS